MQKDVDTLQQDAMYYDQMVVNCLNTIQTSEETHTTEVKNINRELTNIRRALTRVQDSQALIPKRPESPSPRVMEARKYGGAFLVRLQYLPLVIRVFLPYFRTVNDENNVSTPPQYFPRRLY